MTKLRLSRRLWDLQAVHRPTLPGISPPSIPTPRNVVCPWEGVRWDQSRSTPTTSAVPLERLSHRLDAPPFRSHCLGGSCEWGASLLAHARNKILQAYPPLQFFDTNKLPIGGLLSRPIFNAVASSPSAAFVPLLGMLRGLNGRPFMQVLSISYLPSYHQTSWMGSNKLNGHRHISLLIPFAGLSKGTAVYRCDPPGSEAPLPKYSFFIAGPRVLDRPTSVETQTRWMRGFPGCVCIVDLQLRKDWAANDRVSIRIYQYRTLPDLALWLQPGESQDGAWKQTSACAVCE